MRLSVYLKEYEEFAKIERKAETARLYSVEVRHFIVYMRDCELSAVYKEDFVPYLRLLFDLGYTQNSMSLRSSALRAFWKYLNRMGRETFSYEAIPVIQREAVIPKSITEEHYEILRKEIQKNRSYTAKRDLALVELLWDTGARIGEILSVNIEDLDLEKMKCKIKTEKAKGSRMRYPFREIFWTKETNETLKAWLSQKEKFESSRHVENPEALFIGSNHIGVGLRLNQAGASHMVARYCRKAKIPIAGCHQFRHHFGNDLAARNCNNSILMALMGHASLSSSQIYTQLSDKQSEEAYAKFKRNKDTL